MPKVLRSIVAVIAGFVAASAVMIAVESFNTHVLYPELGKSMEGVTDKEAIKAVMAGAPAGAFTVVVAGWVLGSFAGGFVAAWIGRNAPERHAVVLGALLTLAGIANNLMLPPPVWFWAITFVAFIPPAYAGTRLVPRNK